MKNCLVLFWEVTPLCFPHREADVPIEFDDKLGGVLPFFHIYGQVLTLLLTLREGASVVSMKKFDFVKFLQMIQDDDVSKLSKSFLYLLYYTTIP